MSIRVLLLLAAAARAGVFTVTALRAWTVEAEGGATLLELRENVVVSDGEVTVVSDSATLREEEELAEFSGDVRVTHDSVSATGRYLSYSRPQGLLLLTGNAVLNDGESVLRADRITWFRFAGKATALGGVVMTGDWLGEVTGEYALYDRERGSFFVTSEPVLRRAEEGDSMTITAQKLEFFLDGERAEAQGDALLRMPSRELIVSAEYLLYFGEEDRLEMVGSPQVEAPEGALEGDWMEMRLRDGDPESLRIEGNARGNLGRGDSVTVDFNSQKAFFGFIPGMELDSLHLSGTATLTAVSSGRVRAEANTITAEDLVLRFRGGDLDRMTARGTVRGTYSWSGESSD